jgi:hypothetical protein
MRSFRFSSLFSLVAVLLRSFVETVVEKGKLPVAEKQLADAGIQVDEVGVVYEQYMDYFSGKDSGAGRGFVEDEESRDSMAAVSKPVRVSFEGNIGVGKSTILKLLQSHPRLRE